jgi:hypothetical protein
MNVQEFEQQPHYYNHETIYTYTGACFCPLHIIKDGAGEQNQWIEQVIKS